MTQAIQNFVGKEIWKVHLGEVDEEPSFPEEIGENEIAVFIPTTLNGEPLTLNYFLSQLPERVCRQLGPAVKRSFGDKQVLRAHWVQLEKNPQTWAVSCRRAPQGKCLPPLLDTVIAVAMWYLATQERLFVQIDVCCQGSNHCQYLTVGKFGEEGFSVVYRNRGDVLTLMWTRIAWARK